MTQFGIEMSKIFDLGERGVRPMDRVEIVSRNEHKGFGIFRPQPPDSAHLRVKLLTRYLLNTTWTLPLPTPPLSNPPRFSESADVHQWLVWIAVHANSRSVNLFQRYHYPYSHYPSVVCSTQLIVSIVSDVSKIKFCVNGVPSTRWSGCLSTMRCGKIARLVLSSKLSLRYANERVVRGAIMSMIRRANWRSELKKRNPHYWRSLLSALDLVWMLWEITRSRGALSFYSY